MVTLSRLGSRDKPHYRQLLLAHNPSWMGFKYLYGGEVRAVFDLEVFGASETRRVRGGFVLAPLG
jgi:hypothetical protein